MNKSRLSSAILAGLTLLWLSAANPAAAAIRNFSGALASTHDTWDRMTVIGQSSGQIVHWEMRTFQIAVDGEYTITVNSSQFAPAINTFATKFFPATPIVNFWTNGEARSTPGTVTQTTWFSAGTYDLVISAFSTGQIGAFTGSIEGPSVEIVETATTLIMLNSPLPQTIAVGTSATLSVGVEGANPRTYQWYEGPAGDVSNPVPGATSATFVTAPFNSVMEKFYWVRITNAYGSLDSESVRVNARTGAQSFTGNLRPGNRQWFRPNGSGGVVGFDTFYKIWAFRVTTPGTYTFTLNPSGFNGTMHIYSFFNPETPNTSHYTNTITGSPVTMPVNFVVGGLNYYLVVSCSQDQQTGAFTGTVTGPGYLTELPAPQITQHPIPVSQTLWGDEDPAPLDADVDLPGANLEWRYWNGAAHGAEHTEVLLSGANSLSYDPPPIPSTRAYWLRAFNSYGYEDSNLAVMHIRPAPNFTATPSNATIAYGNTVTLNAAAGNAPFTFKWYAGSSGTTTTLLKTDLFQTNRENFLNSGATSFTTPILLPGTHRYWIRAENPTGHANSSSVTITVQKRPLTLTLSIPETTPYDGAPRPASVSVSDPNPGGPDIPEDLGISINPPAANTGSSSQTLPAATPIAWIPGVWKSRPSRSPPEHYHFTAMSSVLKPPRNTSSTVLASLEKTPSPAITMSPSPARSPVRAL